MNIKTLSVSKLKDLRRQVEATIYAKVEERRQEIEAELSRLSHFNTGHTKGATAHMKKKVVLRVRKRLDENSSLKASTPKQSTKPRKARKKAPKPEIIVEARPLMPTSPQNIEAVRVEPPSAAPISVNDIPVELGAAA
jgi:hypothetical protein